MANGRTGRIMPSGLRAVFDLGPIGDLSDGQLLERSATDRAEGAEIAFAALVERHEGLVWRVCRGILRDRHEAEDAFQATFVVLVRRARSLWVRDSLGPWLHEVAVRTALRHRAATPRRRDREAHAARPSDAFAPASPALDTDLAAALHEELARLPTSLRAPLVLCDLTGATHAEAARSLGWPIGTVKSRQARGRRTLRARLARRGFDSLGVGPLAQFGSFGTESTSLIRDRAATWARRGFVSLSVTPPAVHLAQETIRTMLWIKLRPIVAALALGLPTIAIGGFVSLAQEPALPAGLATAPPPVAPLPRPADAADARLKVRAQEIATQRARIAIDQARLERELAELDIAQYEEVAYPDELRAVNDEIVHAENALKRARDRMTWSTAMELKGYVPKESALSDRRIFAKAKFTLDQVQTGRDVLTSYTHDKRLKALRAATDRAHAREVAFELAWRREQAKEATLRPKLGVQDPVGFVSYHIGAFW